MAKYDPLRAFLVRRARHAGAELELSFADIDGIIGGHAAEQRVAAAMVGERDRS